MARKKKDGKHILVPSTQTPLRTTPIPPYFPRHRLWANPQYVALKEI